MGNQMAGTFGSNIKSVQRGEKTLGDSTATDTVTITAVDTSKAFVVISYSYNSNVVSEVLVDAFLTNTTTITFTRGTGTNIVIIAWQVVEFF